MRGSDKLVGSSSSSANAATEVRVRLFLRLACEPSLPTRGNSHSDGSKLVYHRRPIECVSARPRQRQWQWKQEGRRTVAAQGTTNGISSLARPPEERGRRGAARADDVENAAACVAAVAIELTQFQAAVAAVRAEALAMGESDCAAASANGRKYSGTNDSRVRFSTTRHLIARSLLPLWSSGCSGQSK